MEDKEFKAYLEKLARLRGIPFQFDRFQSETVVSDGIRLRLEVIAVDAGRPVVVFIPGTSVYALLYGEFLLALADRGYNIVGVDPRGHGRSEGRRGSYTIAELVADARAGVAYARGRFNPQVALAGSSQGGIVAFYTAATDEKLAGVVCHNVADLSDPESVRLTRHPRFSRVMKPVVKFFARLAPEMKIPVSFYLDLAAEPMRGFGNAENFLDQDPLAYRSISLRSMASLASEPLARPVEQITTPVQILHAGRDNIFPQDYIEAIYQRLTCKKSLKIYPDLPHLILTEQVDRVIPDVVEWLEEIFH